MYKRRHWRDLHGGNSSGSSSDEDSESEISASEDEDSGSQDVSSASISDNEESQESGPRDVGSDDGSDHDQAADDDVESKDGSIDAEELTADHVIKAWTSSDPEAQNFKGMPLRCKACTAMLLNRAAYLTHMSSKKHLRKVEGLPASKKDKPILVLAGTEEEEVETHTERLQRIQRELAELQAQKAKTGKQTKTATLQAKAKSALPGDKETNTKAKEQGPDRGKAGKAATGTAPDNSIRGKKKAGAKDEKQQQQQTSVRSQRDKSARQFKLAAQAPSDSDDDEQQQQEGKKVQKGSKPDRVRPGKRERAELKAQLTTDKRKRQRAAGQKTGKDSNGTEGNEGTYMNSKARRKAAREAARKQAT